MKRAKPTIKDSGKRQSFDTGAVRDTNEDKGSFDQLPYYALLQLAKHYEAGSRKYKKNNWRKGIPISRYFDSAQRHLAKYAMGFEDEFHIRAAFWNIASLMETKKRIELGQLPKELDDFPYVNMEYDTDKD